MYFALFYILFFGVDILLVSNFQILGMIPMSFLVAGTGVFLIFYLLRHNKIFKIDSRSSFLFNLFVPYIILISFFNLVRGTYPVFSPAVHFSTEKWFAITSLIYKVIFILSLIVFFSAFSMLFLKHSLNRWVFYSAAIALIRYGIPIFLKILPPLLYRYFGVFDLIMLFGWLMIISTFIKKEYGFDISQN